MKNIPASFRTLAVISLISSLFPTVAASEECSQHMQSAVEQLALPDAVKSVVCVSPMAIKITRNEGKNAEIFTIDMREVDTFGQGAGSIEVFCGKKGCVKYELYEGKRSTLASSRVTLNAMHSIQAGRAIDLLTKAKQANTSLR